MRSLSRGIWQYAILLIVLFAIASIAAYTTISYIHTITSVQPEAMKTVTFMVWALTMGFMLIAGAFGLWTIQFSAEAEGRLRVSEVVATMDYLDDILLVVDKRGRITGTSPAFRLLIKHDIAGKAELVSVFPCLKEDDVSLLLDLEGPNEVQRDLLDEDGRRALRFRSQTAGGVNLLLVSDVTDVRIRESRKQQIARFELIGRIVRGAAHDFSSILSGIAGHSALLPRLQAGSAEMLNSIDTISKEAGRGAALASHLLEFGRLRPVGKPTDKLGEHVEKAGKLIRVGLSSTWQLEVSVEKDLPPVALSGLQIEQMVLNLAVAAADALPAPGEVRVSAGRPGSDHLFNIGEEFAAAVVVSAAKPGVVLSGFAGAGEELGERTHSEDAGAVQSVVRSMLQDTGGALHCFRGPDNSWIYRICLPYGTIDASADEDEELPAELMAYVTRWRVLLAWATEGLGELETKLGEIGLETVRVDNLVSTLARIEAGQGLHAIIVGKAMFGDEAVGLLKAIIKLCPGTGVVVLCDDPDLEQDDLVNDVVFVARDAGIAQVVRAMVEAKGLAARRSQSTV